MNQLPPDEIVEAYVFANTPAYLLRKLSGSEFISELMAREQADLIRLIEASTSERVESIALAYAALFALLRKNIDQSVARTLSAAKKLEWAPALISLYEQTAVSVSFAKVRPPTVFTGSPSFTDTGITQSLTVVKVPQC
jgi:hypothetical protein